MAFAHSHLQAASRIISGYDGRVPFPDHARAYFRSNKQHGGRDRKSISALCYAVLRTGASLQSLDIGQRAVAGLFLTQEGPGQPLQALDAEWNALLPLPMEEKVRRVQARHPDFDPLNIFPWHASLGQGIDPLDFSLSHLLQPDLFIRLRPGRGPYVMQILDKLGIGYEKVGDSALRVAPGIDLAASFPADRDLVIQDLSSQRVAELLEGRGISARRMWDCCAGSGGKSILLHDIFPDAALSASDIRTSILHNLRTRLDAAGMKSSDTFVADLEHTALKGQGPFDIVVADVPCTGSGTWGRNPEWLTHFDPSMIPAYAARQKAIARHAAGAVTKGGHFLYVTCSVFRAENEEVVSHLLENTGLKLEEMRYLKGYGERADSMFAARFISPA